MGNLPGDLSNVKYPFVSGGEMGKRTNEKDWKKTTLETPDSWPHVLRITLNTLLQNKLPAFLFWGSDLVTFYNDAAMSILEEVENPISILGLSAKNSLPPGWKVLKAHIEQVFRTGESFLIENKRMPFSKNKKEKQAYWTFSFTCVMDEFGMPAGVILTAIQIEECPTDDSGLFEEVSEHAAQLNYIINAAELGTWNVNTDTNKINLNPRASEWFGLSGEENLLDALLKTIVDEDRQSVINKVDEAIKPGSNGIYQVKYSIVNPGTSEKRRLLAIGKAQFNDERRVFRFGGILQDITEEYLLIEKLRNTEERLLLAIETSEMGMWEFDIPLQELTHSSKLAELLGFKKSAILGVKEMNGSVHPEDLPYLANEFMPELLKKGRMQIEYRIIKKTGATIWVRNHSKVIYDENDLAIKLIGTLHDITEQKEHQNKIEASEQNLRAIVESGPFPIGVYSAKDERLEMVNQSWVKTLGRGRHLVGKKYLEIFPEYERQLVYRHFKEAIKTGNSFQSEQERVDLEKAGVLDSYYFNYTITPIKNAEGKVIRLINSAVDVTESVLAKNKLIESEAGFRLLAESMPQFVWSGNKEGTINYVNQEVFNYTGLSLKKITGENLLNIIHEKDRVKTVALLRHSLETGEDFIVEHRFQRYDGVYRWQLSRAVSLKDANGEIQMWVGTSTDIQEIKEEEELKDFFISMASHELKTPITSLKAYVQVLLSNYSESNDPFLYKSLKIVDKQIIKLTNLISELLDISKIKSGKLNLNIDQILLNELVADTIEAFSISNPEFTISFHCKEDLYVMADIERISQVLINFLSNAIKYSADSKNIEVTCQVKHSDVEISVTDHGIGINKAELPRIFERFFRGGGNYEKTIPGFGIGLYIAEDIIKRHGGDIGADSEPEKGSRFYFSLPLMDKTGDDNEDLSDSKL